VDADSPAEPYDIPGLREVQAGVLPEVLQRRAIVRLGRLDFVGEVAQMHILLVQAYHGRPLFDLRVPVDAFELRGPAPAPHVAQVFGLRALPEVPPAVVPMTSVDVIHDQVRRRIHDQPVHDDILASDGRSGVSFFSPCGLPFVLAQPSIVGRIDDDK
jgi:hypothetical protein